VVNPGQAKELILAACLTQDDFARQLLSIGKPDRLTPFGGQKNPG
jgi:hypothetical protein